MVEKHYTYNKCRNAPYFLTCVDCLKDFSGDEFRAHTKCISENEKYSAKGFVAKPDRNKGAQKQEAWTEIIQTHLQKRTDLDDYTRKTLDHISQQTNIPRKQAKFINFVSNCMRMSPNNAQTLWKVVEKALEEFQAREKVIRDEQAAKQKVAKEEREAAKAAAAASSEVAAEPEEKKKKKDKKRKAEDDPAESIADEKPPKKSKKDKQVNEVTSTTDVVEAPSDSTEKKSKKSKKRKIDESVSDEAPVSTSFEWKKVITEVLQKKDSVKLTKLKDKVLKKLTAFNEGVAPTAKDEKKYQKHLDQLAKFIQIDGETVKLIAEQ